MRDRLSDYQEQYGDLYNLEATPAESTSYRLAKHDRKFYPDIITAADADQGKTPYYTNSSHLPVGYTDDIFAALDVQDELQTLYTSGTVFHAFLGEKLPDWRSTANLVRKIAENYKLPYYTMSPTYSVCQKHGYIAGEHYTCPDCGAKTEVYSRITGYYRPVQNWNAGKSQEFKHRLTYDIANSKLKRTAAEPVAEPEAPVAASADAELLLFTTPTCPNCPLAKAALDRAGIAYTVINANDEPDLCRSLDIRTAPTLAVRSGNDAAIYAGVPAIKQFIAASVKA